MGLQVPINNPSIAPAFSGVWLQRPPRTAVYRAWKVQIRSWQLRSRYSFSRSHPWIQVCRIPAEGSYCASMIPMKCPLLRRSALPGADMDCLVWASVQWFRIEQVSVIRIGSRKLSGLIELKPALGLHVHKNTIIRENAPQRSWCLTSAGHLQVESFADISSAGRGRRDAPYPPYPRR